MQETLDETTHQIGYIRPRGRLNWRSGQFNGTRSKRAGVTADAVEQNRIQLAWNLFREIYVAVYEVVHKFIRLQRVQNFHLACILRLSQAHGVHDCERLAPRGTDSFNVKSANDSIW